MKKYKKILVMGLPGSGKSTLSKILAEKIDAFWLNADQIRKKFNENEALHKCNNCGHVMQLTPKK